MNLLCVILSLSFCKYRKLDCLLLQIVDFKEDQVRAVPFWLVHLLITEATQTGHISSQLQQIGQNPIILIRVIYWRRVVLNQLNWSCDLVRLCPMIREILSINSNYKWPSDEVHGRSKYIKIIALVYSTHVMHEVKK